MAYQISSVSTKFYIYLGEPAPSTAVSEGGVITVSSGTVPYMPLTAPAAEVTKHVAELSKLGIAFKQFPIFTAVNEGQLSRWPDSSNPSVTGNLTYYIPYRLPETLGYDAFGTIMSRIALQSPVPSQSSEEATSIGSSPTQISSAGSSETTQTSASSIFTPPGMVWANTTVPKSTHVGAVVGGSLGGLVAGIVIVLIAFACLKYRKSRRSRKNIHQSRPGDEDTAGMAPPYSKQTQGSEFHTDVTGWQKHLPQEKDDKTIIDAVKTIFDQVQVHIEGFYRNRPGNLTSSTVAALDHVSPEGLSRKLSEGPNSISILEGILIRWLIHRISLRSDAGDSFLPLEYTKIPEQNGLHMEIHENGSGQTGSCKKGFPQAFAKWRTLTAFLYPNSNQNEVSKKHLNVRIDQGVRTLTDAFSPWESEGKSVTNRNKSLRNILQLTNDLGHLLFAQPSTFVFDWSNDNAMMTVSPALLKRLDEYAKPVLGDTVLIAARRVDL